MESKSARAALTVAAVAALFATAARCEASTYSISANDLAASIDSKIEASGAKSVEVACAEDLNATTGATAACKASADGVRGILKVEFTERDGDTVNFKWEVVEGTQVMSAEAVEQTVSGGLRQRVGVGLSSLDCPDGDIAAKVGKVVRCDAVAEDGDRGTVVITVTAVEEMDVAFDWEWQ